MKSVLPLLSISLLLWLVACAGSIERLPAATPQGLAVTFTVTPSVLPSATNTPYAATIAPTPVKSTPTWAPTAQPTVVSETSVQPATVTPPPLPPIIWSEQVEVMSVLPAADLRWSPVVNELLVTTCPVEEIEMGLDAPLIYVAAAPDFDPVDFTPGDFACNPLIVGAGPSLSWSPDGQHMLFTGHYRGQAVSYEVTYLWQIARQSRHGQSLPGVVGRWLRLAGWMDGRTAVYSSYVGGGHREIVILNVHTGEKIAETTVHVGGVNYVNTHYVATDNGAGYDFFISAAVLSREAITPNSEQAIEMWGPHLKHLSSETGLSGFTSDLSFNSRYVDWLPDSNKMLVLTWPADVELWQVDLLHDPSVTQLQVWDVETDVLTLLIPNAIDGRFSPDRRHLAYITPSRHGPWFHLLDRVTGEIGLSLPVAATVSGYSTLVDNPFSFSPDGRYFTFFTPGPLELNQDSRPVGMLAQAQGPEMMHVLDTESGEVIFAIEVSDMLPVWSPGSSHFLIRDRADNLMLAEVAPRQLTPLVTQSALHIRKPQWSHDGRYLSVSAVEPDNNQTVVGFVLLLQK
jgi:Tol biopolymer transport system component